MEDIFAKTQQFLNMIAKAKQEYINREISWMAFNERVLQEADDDRNPLIERMRFLGIYSNNMDEFFRVRVATLRRMTQLGKRDLSTLDEDPNDVLEQVMELVRKQQKRYEKLFNLLDADLRKENISLLKTHELSEKQALYVNKFFQQEVRQDLYPVMVTAKNKFPPLEDHTIYLMIVLNYKSPKKTEQYAVVQIPSNLPRFVVLPREGDRSFVMFLDDVIRTNLNDLFAIYGADEISAYTMKITRDAELDIDEDISKSLLQKMATGVAQRKKGDYVRFLYDDAMPDSMLQFITSKLGVSGNENVIAGGRYHNKKDFMSFPVMGRKDLCFPPRPPLAHPGLEGHVSLFSAISKGDMLLHYPYQKFDYVVHLLREAAIDPDVKSIRINLYRVAEESHVVNALINAVKNGVKVMVVMELQARFDERNNIKWSKRLQEAGATVIHGVPGLKVHSKLLLIRRRENRKTVRYAHIGTGNFHEKTAGIYSDLAMLTTQKSLCKEVRKVFDFFENNYHRSQYRHLLVSPFNIRRRLNDLIKKEVSNAQKGIDATIVLKLNNLVDTQMIRRLYEASQAGVRVQLLIRGICSLVPGVEGLSDNITVTSIVGRFLEHARIFYFSNAGSPLYFISSADWMTRNLDYRIEVAAPLTDPKLISELDDILRIQLAGNVKARVLDKSLKNRYVQRAQTDPVVHAQEELYQYYKAKLE